MKLRLDHMASRLISGLKKNNFVMQRYNAYSTNSIYIKLDFGVSNSIRISDHDGKEKLKYRYNLITGCEDNIIEETSSNGSECVRYFYNENSIEALFYQIIIDRKLKVQKYGANAYRNFMLKNVNDNKDKKGFWQNANIINNMLCFEAGEEVYIFEKNGGHIEARPGNTVVVPKTKDYLQEAFQKESNNLLPWPSKFQIGDKVISLVPFEEMMSYFMSFGYSFSDSTLRADKLRNQMDLTITNIAFFESYDEEIYYVVKGFNGYSEVVEEWMLQSVINVKGGT